jgi:hypothetical protein
MGQLTLSMGPVKVEVCLFLNKQPIFPSKKVSFLHLHMYKHHTCY